MKTIYSNERPLLGIGGSLIREGALIKKFFIRRGYSFERGALSRGGVHSDKYGMSRFLQFVDLTCFYFMQNVFLMFSRRLLISDAFCFLLFGSSCQYSCVAIIASMCLS